MFGVICSGNMLNTYGETERHNQRQILQMLELKSNYGEENS